jgi:hypothetical protein
MTNFRLSEDSVIANALNDRVPDVGTILRRAATEDHGLLCGEFLDAFTAVAQRACELARIEKV